METLEALVRELGDNLAAGSGGGATAGPETGDGTAPSGASGVRSWLLTEDPERVSVALAALVVWVDRVYLAYHQVSLPSCWLWHPDVVEELWWLYQAHTDAYHPITGSWLRAGDWHDRQRLNVVGRLKFVLAHCNPERHRLRTPPVYGGRAPISPESIDAVAVWLATGRPGEAPLPPLDEPISPPQPARVR